jgi:hypothetical protein
MEKLDKGCVGEFETAFDGEMKAIADLIEYVSDNEIPKKLGTKDVPKLLELSETFK